MARFDHTYEQVDQFAACSDFSVGVSDIHPVLHALGVQVFRVMRTGAGFLLSICAILQEAMGGWPWGEAFVPACSALNVYYDFDMQYSIVVPVSAHRFAGMSHARHAYCSSRFLQHVYCWQA
jgi:hypothetical protein